MFGTGVDLSETEGTDVPALYGSQHGSCRFVRDWLPTSRTQTASRSNDVPAAKRTVIYVARLSNRVSLQLFAGLYVALLVFGGRAVGDRVVDVLVSVDEDPLTDWE